MTIWEIFEKLEKILEKLDDIYHMLRGEESPDENRDN